MSAETVIYFWGCSNGCRREKNADGRLDDGVETPLRRKTPVNDTLLSENNPDKDVMRHR